MIPMGFAALAVIASAAAAQSSTRELRVLTPSDSDLVPVAIAAAKTLEPDHAGRVKFAGVMVNGHEARAASDAVVKAIDGERVDDSRRVPFVICRQGESCPEVENARNDRTYAFTNIRATADTVFVGGTERSTAHGERPLCIVVARAGQVWTAAGTRDVRNAKRCGE